MSDVGFKDHFSGHAAAYAAARPAYPDALFDWLAAQCPRRELAWDAGCGNGQASVALAAHFRRVHAGDPSAAQIAAAAPHPRVTYVVERGERCGLPDASADLVAVAQALHWFDLAAFYAEVRRVLRPGGVIAAWTYGLNRIEGADDPGIDALLRALHDRTLGPYWPPERRHAAAGYRDLPFPFAEFSVPDFTLRCDWTLPQFLAYLASWSAAQRHLAATGRDAIAAAAPALQAAWGDPQQTRAVIWPLAIRAGRTEAAITVS